MSYSKLLVLFCLTIPVSTFAEEAHDLPASTEETIGTAAPNLGLATPDKYAEMYYAGGVCELTTKGVRGGEKIAFQRMYMHGYRYNGTGFKDRWGIAPEIYDSLYPPATKEEQSVTIGGVEHRLEAKFDAGEGGGVSFEIGLGIPLTGPYDPSKEYVFSRQSFHMADDVKATFDSTFPVSKEQSLRCHGRIRDLKTPAALLVWGAITRQMQLKDIFFVTLDTPTLQKMTGLSKMEVETALDQMKASGLLRRDERGAGTAWVTQ